MTPHEKYAVIMTIGSLLMFAFAIYGLFVFTEKVIGWITCLART